MKNYFYSAETNGFYLLSLKSIYEKSTNGWPADAVPISDEVYQELLGGQSQGKFIVSDKNGNPMLTMPPEPTKEDKILMIKEKIKAHLACATEKIGPLQDAVDLDIATELEIQKLMEWKTYRIKLNRLEIIDTSNIKFPQCPE